MKCCGVASRQRVNGPIVDTWGLIIGVQLMTGILMLGIGSFNKDERNNAPGGHIFEGLGIANTTMALIGLIFSLVDVFIFRMLGLWKYIVVIIPGVGLTISGLTFSGIFAHMAITPNNDHKDDTAFSMYNGSMFAYSAGLNTALLFLCCMVTSVKEEDDGIEGMMYLGTTGAAAAAGLIAMLISTEGSNGYAAMGLASCCMLALGLKGCCKCCKAPCLIVVPICFFFMVVASLVEIPMAGDVFETRWYPSVLVHVCAGFDRALKWSACIMAMVMVTASYNVVYASRKVLSPCLDKIANK